MSEDRFSGTLADCSVNACGAQQLKAQAPAEVVTVGTYWASQVEQARKALEHALIMQAKAEVAGIHKFPHNDLAGFVYNHQSFPF